MLHRPASAPVWSPLRRIAARVGVVAGPSAGLLRYVLIAAVLCTIGCVYIWQVNELSNIHERTLNLQWQARQLEQKNVVLSIQLAQWNSPAYVDQRSIEQGYLPAPQHTISVPEVAAVSEQSAVR